MEEYPCPWEQADVIGTDFQAVRMDVRMSVNVRGTSEQNAQTVVSQAMQRVNGRHDASPPGNGVQEALESRGGGLMRVESWAAGALAVFALAVSGCGQKQPPAPVSRTDPATAPEPPTDGPIVLLAGDPAALKRYLQTVQEVKPIRFDVEWNPDVVPVDRATTIRTLLSVSPDGTRFAFFGRDPSLDALAPGKILFLWGVALRRVTLVQRDGDHLSVVTTGVSLPEAFRQADIEFDYPIPSTAPIVVPHEQAEAAQPTAMTPSDEPRFMRVANTTTESPGAPPPAPAAPEVVFDLGLNTYKVSGYHGFDIDAKYGPQGDGIAFSLEARLHQDDLDDSAPEMTANPRKDMDAASKAGRDANAKALRNMQDKSDAQKRADEKLRQNEISDGYKKTAKDGPLGPLKGKTRDLFKIGSSQWDLRLRAAGTFHGTSTNNGLAVGSHILIKDSSLALMRTNFNNVNGNLKFQFIARRGEKSEQWINSFKVELPLRFNIPVIVGGLPMMFQVAFNFIAKPALATKNDSFVGEYEIPFGGNRQVSISDNKFTTSGTLKTIPQMLKSLGSSVGVSAVLVAIQAPRVGLGLNLFAASSVAYIDLVTTATITSAGKLGMFPCRNFQLVSTVNAGVDTQVSLDLPGIAKLLGQPLNDQLKKASDMASTRETVFRKEMYRNEPDIKACQLTGK